MRIHKTGTSRFPRFGIDMSGEFLTDKTCFFATGENLFFIISILNSYVGKYMCKQYVSILDDGGFLMQKIFLDKFPIISYDKLIENELIKISKLTTTNEEKDKLIDKIIYELYGFTDDEIKFIESL